MIARAMIALGLVWLTAPHEPDLGLAAPAAPCAFAPACGHAMLGETARGEILRRLHEMRAELQGGTAPSDPSPSTRREAALQNAGRFPAMPVGRLADIAPRVPR